ncbi:tyrosine-type recombinase/integrase [Psychrobacter sp. T6-6]|uniref:tyrosine-type recombinase/integrase n=1 Tax=Psychrobacter sp. T6-6 TaxID=3457452 RepID=UPI003FD3A1BA
MAQRKSGIKERAENRSKETLKRKNLSKRIVRESIDFDKIIASNDPQTIFNAMWEQLDKRLLENKHFQGYLGYVEGYNEAVKCCQDYIENKDIDIGFPKLIVTSYRPKSFRNEVTFSENQQILDFYLYWIDGIASKAYELTITDLMLSLIFHSAVLKKLILQTLISRISDKSLTIESIFELPVTTLIIDDDSYHTNTYNDSTAVHEVKVFLSPLTSYLIKLYNKKGKTKKVSLSTDIHKLYQTLQMTKSLSQNQLSMTLKKFLIGAVYVLEDYLFLDLPEHTWYLLIGWDSTYGLSTANWQSLIFNISHETLANVTTSIEYHNDVVVEPRKANPTITVEIAKLFKKNKDEKISMTTFSAGLKQLYERLSTSDAPLSEIAIVGWLLTKTVTCKKVSSVQTYSGTITNRWLSLTQGVALEEHTEEDYIQFYSELIELGKSKDAKNTIATRIDEIHEYLVNQHNIEPIAPLSSTKRAHHRTGYLSETMFQAILSSADNLEMTKDELEAVKLALILGQRCGLRIGEIVKIRLKDVAITSAYLEVRDNKYGNNKTGSALRRTLLEQLLTDSDMLFFRKVELIRGEGKGDTLIANQAGMAYRASDLSKILSQLIKTVTGLPHLTTHHLRHSFLTNFQLMSFMYDQANNFKGHKCTQALKDLLPYDEEKSCEILAYIETSLQYKKIYALAGVAGHASPSTTFESYVHLTDIQIGLLLWHMDYHLTSKHHELISIPRRLKKQLAASPVAVNDYLLNKLKLKPLPKPKHSKRLKRADKKSTKPKRYSFDEVRQILEVHNREEDFKEKMDVYKLDQNTFEMWLENARRLRNDSAFKTTHGNSRLFASDDNRSLLPVLDRYAEDNHMLMQMTNKFRDLYKIKDNREPMLQFVGLTLTNSQYYKNHISFNEALDLYSYIQILRQLVLKKNINLKIYHYAQAKDDDKKEWQPVMKLLASSQIKNCNVADKLNGNVYKKKIRAELSLSSQTEQTRLNNREKSNLPIKQWTVRTLQIFCHYAFIMIGQRINLGDHKP